MLTFAAIILLGLVGGMVVNYLADTLPRNRRLGQPVCLHCGAPQELGNYLFWPRKCAQCGHKRGGRSWIVELASVLLGLGLWRSTEMGSILGLWPGALVLVYFGVVVVIDIEHRLILHPVSAAGAVLGLGVGVYLHGVRQTLWGGAAGLGIVFGMYLLGWGFSVVYSRFSGRPLGEDAFGFGDVILGGVLGLYLGWPFIALGIMLAVLAAGIYSAVYTVGMLLTRRYRRLATLPYGPFFILGAFLLLFLPGFAQKLLVGIFPG